MHILAAVGACYAGASVLCFIAYARDKAAARAGRWRTPERTLLLLGLAGGWPGAMLAQRWLRHKSNKSNKAGFRLAFRATVLLNLAALAYFLGSFQPAILGQHV